jgi:glycosyltransferase involved in cell wall biosynthesis
VSADRPAAILHAPADVGGNAYGLSRAERELGLVSDVAVFSPGVLGYGYDLDLRAGIERPVWLRLARRADFLRRAVRKYDVFHFNFGLTLLTVRQLGHVADELALLRRLGKTVLVTYQGCDVRPKASCPCRNPGCLATHQYRQPAANRALRYADRVFFLNPDLRHWLPGARFVPYASVDARKVQPVAAPDAEELVVAHAPTDRLVKGTAHVISAVEALRQEGVSIRLDLIEDVTHHEALHRLAAADVVVDQLVLGWYGAVAVEAMALGRPVLAYIREDEPEDNPFGSKLPIVRTTAGTLAAELRRLAADRAERHALAAAGRRFVEEEHDPRKIARTVLEGLVPLPGDGATPMSERGLSARAPR